MTEINPHDGPAQRPSASAWRHSAAWSEFYDATPALGRKPLDLAFLARPLPESLAQVAERQPDRPAVVDGAGTLTYRQLLDLIGRLGAAIRRSGPAASPIGIYLPDSGTYAAALFAGLWIARVFYA